MGGSVPTLDQGASLALAQYRWLFKNWRCYKPRDRQLEKTVFEACLRTIGADSELEVLKVSDDKMRLREGFDAAKLSGGYRDIQLCVRLNTESTRALGVHVHLCEVQLHFAPIIKLKSGGGHKTYVLRRNLSGN